MRTTEKDWIGASPETGGRRERGRRRLVQADIGLALVAAVAADLLAPGLAVVAVVALVVLAICAISLVIGRRTSRRALGR